MITSTPLVARMAAVEALEEQKRQLLKQLSFAREGMSVSAKSGHTVLISDKDGDCVIVGEEEAKWLVECLRSLFQWESA